MSPTFEQQVAEALYEARQQWRPKDIQERPDLMDWLAPRVAAAIEVALRADGVHPGAYEAALRELRADERIGFSQ